MTSTTRRPEDLNRYPTTRLRWLPLPVLTVFAGGLGYAVMSLQREAPGLADRVADKLAVSGVSNPVTAVLLNFRGYDTLLEMGVLLLALTGVLSFSALPIRRVPQPGQVLTFMAQLLTPVMIVVAGYLLWAGAHAPGGAFQAGAVLAAAAVLMLLSGKRLRSILRRWPLRLALVLGLSTFIVVGAAVMVGGGRLLEYPLLHAGRLILLIEVMAAISIGLTLISLFLGSRLPSAEGE